MCESILTPVFSQIKYIIIIPCHAIVTNYGLYKMTNMEIIKMNSNLERKYRKNSSVGFGLHAIIQRSCN